ncbi:MAG: hypothetical protein IKD51_07120 [Lactococcus sp.]|nr:hypothetical protein [Lactococcus sp.]
MKAVFRDRTDEAILALSIAPLSKRLSREVSGTLKKGWDKLSAFCVITTKYTEY